MNYEQKMLVLQEAVRIAAKMVSENPPMDMDKYTPGMIWALTGGEEKETRWQTYFLKEAMKNLEMEV